MVNISSIVYKLTGRMTTKQVVRTAETVGLDLIQKAKTKGQLEIHDINDVLVKRLGKKKASKIIISDKLADFKNFVMKNLGLSEDMAEIVYHSSKGAAVPGGGKVNKSFLKINLSSFSGLNEMINTISHECEHLFMQNFSFKVLKEKIRIKIKGKKWLENFKQKYGVPINEKLMVLQANLIAGANVGDAACGGFVKSKKGLQGLLEHMQYSSQPSLHNDINTLINETLITKDNKYDLKALKAVKTLLKDESRAYKVGGKVEALLYPKTDRATKSEILAQLYDETVSVLNTRIKALRINKLRNLFGIKEK